MNSVSVSEMVRRYHVSQKQRNYKERLDTLTENLVREYLEVALDNLGCRPSEILCIRTLNIPIVFNPDKTDFEIFSVWLTRLETAIAELLAKGTQRQCLTYPNIIEALISIARCLVNRQLDYQWAWIQMGIIPKGQHGVSEAKAHWMTYLALHKECVPAVLAGVKEDNTIHHLVRADIFDPKDMAKLLSLNLDAFGISVDWYEILLNVRTSLSNSKSRSNVDEGRVLVTLTALNISWRALFNNSELSSFIADIFNSSKAAKSQINNLTEKLSLFYALLLVSKSSSISQVAASQQRLEIQLVNWLHHCRLWLASQPVSSDDTTNEFKEDDSQRFNIENGNGNRDIENIQPVLSDIENQPTKLIGYFGGVLFLLNLLKEHEWLVSLRKLIDEHQAPTAVLEQLIRIMLPEMQQDAALSVFSGAIFEQTAQNSVNYEFDVIEFTRISLFADSIKLEIVSRLTGSSSEHVEPIFKQFSHKKINVEYAAGWVKVFYSLDDADTNVRASGLDLDPGFIPWLGYMVTFHYE